MAFLNAATRELHVNLAYFGPALAGKTTNLQYIWQKTNPETRSEWAVSLEPFPLVAFYYTPALPPIGDVKLVFHLSAIPGQVFQDQGRKTLLRNVDAVVFVADSQIERCEANLEMLENLQLHLAEQKRADVPMLFQHNKCDLPTAVATEDLEQMLNPGGLPHVRAVASQGAGVFETLKQGAKLIILGISSGQVTMGALDFLKLPPEPLRLWNLFRTDLGARKAR